MDSLIGMTVTKCYKTTDGEVFEDFEDAKTHQIRLNFCDRLEEHLESLEYASGDSARDTDIIMEELDGLAEIFKNYLEERE